jgi:hypothetical protein
MLSITSGRGIHFKFENGWTVSVQWGPGNYADVTADGGRLGCDYHGPAKAAENGESWSAENAEVAIFRPDGDFLRRGVNTTDDVIGWQSPEMVVRIMDLVSRADPTDTGDKLRRQLWDLLDYTSAQFVGYDGDESAEDALKRLALDDVPQAEATELDEHGEATLAMLGLSN